MLLTSLHAEARYIDRKLQCYAEVLMTKHGNELQRQLRFDIIEWV